MVISVRDGAAYLWVDCSPATSANPDLAPLPPAPALDPEGHVALARLLSPDSSSSVFENLVN